jgi:hypothetical protein
MLCLRYCREHLVLRILNVSAVILACLAYGVLLFPILVPIACMDMKGPNPCHNYIVVPLFLAFLGFVFLWAELSGRAILSLLIIIQITTLLLAGYGIFAALVEAFGAPRYLSALCVVVAASAYAAFSFALGRKHDA